MTPWQKYKADCAALGVVITFDTRWAITGRFKYIVDQGLMSRRYLASRRSRNPYPQSGRAIGSFETPEQAVAACEADNARFTKFNLTWNVKE